MHKSRLGVIVLDCQTSDLDAAGAFWQAALGREVNPRVSPGNEHYRDFITATEEPRLLLQAVEHESRVHLDIETDDVEAEAARLERLGARRVGKVREWWVMEAPTGHRFCVVPPQRPDFDTAATPWPDDGDG